MAARQGRTEGHKHSARLKVKEAIVSEWIGSPIGQQPQQRGATTAATAEAAQATKATATTTALSTGCK